MTKKELAKKLNGRTIGDEMDAGLEYIAKDSNLIVIFGASDDLAEIRGAIYDEVSCYDRGVVAFHEGGLLKKNCDSDSCPHEERLMDKAKIVKALWCEGDISCTYETEIPHATFDILEDGEVYCRGIVIDKRDIQ